MPGQGGDGLRRILAFPSSLVLWSQARDGATQPGHEGMLLELFTRWSPDWAPPLPGSVGDRFRVLQAAPALPPSALAWNVTLQQGLEPETPVKPKMKRRTHPNGLSVPNQFHVGFCFWASPVTESSPFHTFFHPP